MPLLGCPGIDWSMSAPLVSTRNALRLVTQIDSPPLRTGPPFLFVSDELPYAELPDVLQVADHAHAVFWSVPLVQMLQPDARELSQPEQYLIPAFVISLQFLIRHETQDLALSLLSPRQPGHAFLSLVYALQRRIDSVGSDQDRGNRACHGQSPRCHTYTPLGRSFYLHLQHLQPMSGMSRHRGFSANRRAMIYTEVILIIRISPPEAG